MFQLLIFKKQRAYHMNVHQFFLGGGAQMSTMLKVFIFSQKHKLKKTKC